MAAATKVFRIVRYFNFKERCEHFALLRGSRKPGETEAGRDEMLLQREFQTRYLPTVCQAGREHEVEEFGELQGLPFGDEFYSAKTGDKLDIWVAPTRAGHPNVIFGTAADEADFWQQLEDPDNEDLRELRPLKTVRKISAIYMKIEA